METTDTYLTIAEPSEGLYKDKGSKFIAYAYPVFTEEEIKEILNELKKSHHNARHHCYAWRLGADMERYRANDDGEPSGTAGRPILGQIRSKELTNIFIVVVRYFGGTLLGVSGLIKAYGTAAEDALEQAEIIERVVEDLLEIKFEYPAMNDVMTIIKDDNLEQLETQFELSCRIVLAVRQSLSGTITDKLSSLEQTKVERIGVR
ncbi:IMPACT family protein [Prolixibacter denitrificans]|uniref:Putative YigZ family protein n=1 Tax=Prolixibacter denitrificans TaxID=1541063 RepID=A0A2P8CE21_9BACT|nr:YigZ family protein [Prolixibacter denitrificans]PSK83228.1 putative YigZ family protein [Prolixibacter denitrificans]GET21889.1 hypothetical protein JCM18694_21350 [Prolixibacter denitrificans]